MSTQNILLIGATGRTGSLVLADALQRGYTVTALVRNPDKIAAQPGLTIVQGSPTSEEDLLKAITSSPKAVTAVLVTLNALRASDSPFAKPIGSPTLMADTNQAIRHVMQRHPEIKKLVIMSAFGAGQSRKHTPYVLDVLFRHSEMVYQYKDHDEVEAATRDSGVNFVLVQPMRLIEGEKASIKNFGNGKGVSMFASISRASVAGFLVDAVESQEWDRKAVVISN